MKLAKASIRLLPRLRPLAGLFTSGAVITFVIVALPWWAYVAHAITARVFLHELMVVAEGQNHGAPFYTYIGYLFLDTVPWCGFMVLGLIEAVRQSRRDVRLRGVLAWFAAIALPLLCIGQKQHHYLVPLMPPLMVMAGWVIDRSLRRDARADLARAARFVLWGTILGLLVLAPLVVGSIWKYQHTIRPVDWALAAGIIVAVALAAWAYRRRGALAGCLALAAGAGPGLLIILALWVPSLDPHPDWDVVAREAGRYETSDGYIMYALAANHRLCFALRQVIAHAGSEPQLAEMLRQRPGATVVLIQKRDRRQLPDPPTLKKRTTIALDDEDVLVYQSKK